MRASPSLVGLTRVNKLSIYNYILAEGFLPLSHSRQRSFLPLAGENIIYNFKI
nr:MAG TPA: hypothetical protein [Caudoviricetes sp.]